LNKEIKDIITHLRFPFSVLLLPIFLFGFLDVGNASHLDAIVLFFNLHVLIYPSSNGFNSLMDNDTGSIGGIKHPPKVPSQMLYVTIALDLVALVITYNYFDAIISFLLLAYIIASRAYSYRGIRLKQYPIVGFLTVAIFQGPIIFITTVLALGGEIDWSKGIFISLAISFLLIGAGYPLSQVYQHEQDKADGVKTLSMLLGIRGTFFFSGIMFFIQACLMGYYFIVLKDNSFAMILLVLCLAPVIYKFNTWMMAVLKNESAANFENTMATNSIGAIAMNVFFIILTLKNIF
jgi:hypothetical protein